MTHSPMEYVTIVIDDTNRQMAKKNTVNILAFFVLQEIGRVARVWRKVRTRKSIANITLIKSKHRNALTAAFSHHHHQ